MSQINPLHDLEERIALAGGDNTESSKLKLKLNWFFFFSIGFLKEMVFPYSDLISEDIRDHFFKMMF